MSVIPFNENTFKTRVNAALERVKTILDNTRHPQYPADVHHAYEDKYLLAQFLTNTALAAQVICLDFLGMNQKTLAQLKDWAKNRSVTLRLKAEESCKFLRKVVREEQSANTHVTTWNDGATRKDFVVTRITEYFFLFTVQYDIFAFMGNEPEKPVLFQRRTGSIELKTGTENLPKPESTVRPSLDLNLSWLLANINDAGQATFTINRSATSCHTPRRNQDVDDALRFMTYFHNWSESVHSYFTSTLFPVHTGHGLDLPAIKDAGLFVPVVPVFEKPTESAGTSTGSGTVPFNLVNPFLAEEKRSIDEKFKELATVIPSNDKIITYPEAKICVLALHLKQICQNHALGIDYIEDMLFKQLVAAIGKEVSPVDFTNYQRFHNRKLFKPEYQPRAFCYAVRRPDHYPEGTLSIEAQLADGSLAEPIWTTVAWAPAQRPMHFSLNASTRVAFGGDRYLHGWVSHQFSGDSGSSLRLVARTRQFSSFILLVGRIVAADLFQPKYGMIIQNKDDLKIPLMLETIPTPKEFKDAIESLSPEQQRFAKGFRAMQLESTLFGICIIQIKPQLEKLLQLPDDSLTKEIQLTQDLMKLFIEYQIPSDLISYADDPHAPPKQKIDTVKGYVSAMFEMIEKKKKVELKEEKEKQAFRTAELPLPPSEMIMPSYSFMSAPPPPPSPVMYSSPAPPPPPSAMSYTPAPPPSYSAPPVQAFSAPPPSYSAPPVQELFSFSTPPPAPIQATRRSSASVSTSAAAPPPSQPSTPVSQPQQQPQQPQQGHPEPQALAKSGDSDVVDYTKIPSAMEKKFDELDVDGALRPTIINPGDTWTKDYQKALLADRESEILDTDQQETERNRAYDLLDALTKSGVLSIDQASLHVVIAATHCFTKTLMNTVIQDNVNPIEKVERSSLIVASSIHNVSPPQLIAGDQLERVGTYSPMLIEAAKSDPSKVLSTAAAATVKQ